MKKIVSLLLILVIATLCLASCSNVTKYELIDIEFANISVSSYEYNYIEFNENNNTYKLENKAKQNGIVTKQTGTYSVDDKGNVSFTSDENPNLGCCNRAPRGQQEPLVATVQRNSKNS